MAKFLPNEILTPIVGHLRDRRIDLFDPVATKDLQSVRLVSSTVSSLMTLSWTSTDWCIGADVGNSDSHVVREYGLRPQIL